MEDRGVPRGSLPGVVVISSGTPLDPGSFDDGTWALMVSATDFSGNTASVIASTFSIVHPGLGLTWAGPFGGRWDAASNWSPASVPGPLDEVTIAAAGAMSVDAISQTISFKSLALGGSGGLNKLKISSTAIAGGVLVLSNGVLEQQGTSALLFSGSVIARSGGKLTHAANSTTFAHHLSIQALGDLQLEAGSVVDADRLGFAGGADNSAGFGPGGGGHDGNRGGAGGGHGGQGGGGNFQIMGNYFYGSRGQAYDDLFDPGQPGSGGAQSYGGAGGGAVILESAGRAALNGSILARGGADRRNSSAPCCGAEARARREAASIEGSGTLDAGGLGSRRTTGLWRQAAEAGVFPDGRARSRRGYAKSLERRRAAIGARRGEGRCASPGEPILIVSAQAKPSRPQTTMRTRLSPCP